MRLSVEPEDGLVDDPPSITLEGAQAGEPIEVELATTDAAARRWRFSGNYTAGQGGDLDLDRDPLADAPSDAPDPSAPFWAMEFASEDEPPVAFSAPPDSLEYELTATSASASEKLKLIRRWTAPGVSSAALSGEGFAGTLFSPEAHRQSAVLLIPGSTGAAAMEPTAALLASRGYPAFVAAYMQEEGLPAALQEIPAEIVGRALAALRTETGVGDVAVLSASVGTQGALAALALDPAAAADCAIAIAPSSVIWQALPANGGRPPKEAAWSHGGESLPWLPIHGERLLPEIVKHSLLQRFSRHPRPSALHVLNAYAPSLDKTEDVERAAIPVEQISCPLLLACGEDDQMWPGARMAAAIAQRRDAAGVGADDVTLSFADAGHFIRPPVTPTTVPWNDALVSGGTAAGSARAQSETWKAMLSFLDAHLSP
jgi:dienelactone hydrolase